MRNHLTEMEIGHALGESRTRVACLIVESIRIALDLLDEQTPTVIQALIDYSKSLKGDPEPRRVLLQAIIKYGEIALEEAKARERRWLHGITGRDPGD
jgi:hypothetical protein